MKLLRIAVPIGFVVLCALVARWLIITREPPPTRQPPPMTTEVAATRLQPTNYPVIIRSQGTVRPRTESTLIPEVSGRVIEIASAFRDGGFFEEGDVLLRLDPRDYETARIVAEAALAQARAKLEEEKAQSVQARENWEQLGSGGDPNPLVLRVPQLAEAQAAVASAEARLHKARRDLDRTRIAAPYAGRMLEKRVDVGQFVSTGTVLARIYAVDYAEIRLPLTNDQLAYMDVPELYRGDRERPQSDAPAVTLKSTIGGTPYEWRGAIVRAEGAFDTQSRQLFVIAQVDDPYKRRPSGNPPLKVGLFVTAEIEGTILENVFALPRSAVRRGDEILLIDPDGKIRRQTISVLWKDSDHIVARDGLNAGEVLCLTPLAFAVDGIQVLATIDGKAPERRRGPGPGSRSGSGNAQGAGGQGAGGPGGGRMKGREAPNRSPMPPPTENRNRKGAAAPES